MKKKGICVLGSGHSISLEMAMKACCAEVSRIDKRKFSDEGENTRRLLYTGQVSSESLLGWSHLDWYDQEEVSMIEKRKFSDEGFHTHEWKKRGLLYSGPVSNESHLGQSHLDWYDREEVSMVEKRKFSDEGFHTRGLLYAGQVSSESHLGRSHLDWFDRAEVSTIERRKFSDEGFHTHKKKKRGLLYSGQVSSESHLGRSHLDWYDREEVSMMEKRKFNDEGFHTHEKEKRRILYGQVSSERLLGWSPFMSRLASRSQSKRNGEDRISLLPDDILVAILSFLSIKEAGRSSVLSCQWRYLWTFCTGKFDLDYGKIPFWRNKFVPTHVNSVLENHRGIVVDELIIRFPGESTDSPDIDSWVDFASRKGVQRFELDLTPPFCNPYIWINQYKFPGIERILSGWNVASEFCSLTCLSLAYVDVTGKVVEHFLAKCRFLKQLVVISSHSLEYLNVNGEALRLESLQVSDCSPLWSLRINADSLMSLTYEGISRALVLMNAPRLSKLTIGGQICSSLNDTPCKLFSFIQQSECFTMKFPPEVCNQLLSSFPRLPTLHHLKHLALEMQWTFGSTVLYYTYLIEACPFLSRFTMQYPREKLIPDISVKTKKVNPVLGSPGFKHECLKVVELVGFEDAEIDFQLAFHLLKIAISLEKLIIVTGQWFRDNDDSRERIRKQLAVRLPSYANIVML